MTIPLVTIVVALLVAGVLCWAARAIGTAFRLPPPLITVVIVLIVIGTLIFILQAMGLMGGGTIRVQGD